MYVSGMIQQKGERERGEIQANKKKKKQETKKRR